MLIRLTENEVRELINFIACNKITYAAKLKMLNKDEPINQRMKTINRAQQRLRDQLQREFNPQEKVK